MSRDFIAETQRNYDTVLGILRDFREQVKSIKGNDDWSEEGRQKRLTQIGLDAIGRLARFNAVLEDARQGLAAMRQSMEIKAKPGNEVIAEMRAREIREWLTSSKNDLEIFAWMLERVDAGDSEGVLAVLNAPMPILTADQAAQIKQAWLEKALPDKVEQADELASLVSRMEMVLQSSERDIRREAGIPEVDVLAQLARTGGR